MSEGDLMRMIGPDGEDLGVALLGPRIPTPESSLSGFFLPQITAQVQADARAFMAAARVGAGLADGFAQVGLAAQRVGAWFCDGEAAAELWCRHHPQRMGGDYRRDSLGPEYHRRRKARGRRGRR